jgi:ATP-binding cassette, subfamily C (CFTR/MRP), member 1
LCVDLKTIARPETQRTLPLALLRCIKKPFLGAIVPRLCLIVFRYSQPVLIKQSIRLVTTPSERSLDTHGYWLIVSAVVVYLGLAVSALSFSKPPGIY